MAEQAPWDTAPAESAPWEEEAPPERGVMERAGSAMSGTFQTGLEHGKKLFTPRTEAEKEEGYGVVGALKGLKETGQGLISPLTMTAGPLMSGAESLIASGVGALQRGTQHGITELVRRKDPEEAARLEAKIPTSEQAYRTWQPNVGTAMLGLGARTGKPPAVGETVPAELERAIVRDADTPAAINQRLTEAQQVRPEATVADVAGENVRGKVEKIAQTPGAGRTTVIPHLEARQKQQLSRIADDLTGTTGTNKTAFRAIEDTIASRGKTARPLWEKAYADGDVAIWTPELEGLSGAQAVQDAMGAAIRNWRDQAIADGYGAMNPGAIVERGGQLEMLHGKVPVFPNLQFWDYVKNSLDIAYKRSVKETGPTRESARIAEFVKQLRGQLDQAVPSYAQARAEWAGPSKYIDAIKDGRSIFDRNITSEEFAADFNALSAAEKEGQRIGTVGAIIQRMKANSAELPDLAKILRSRDMREKMAAIMPTPEAAERYQRALDYEVKSSKLVGRSLANSATYRRAMERQDAESVIGEAIMHAIAPHSSMRGIAINLLKSFSRPVRDRLMAAADERMAGMLTSKQGLPVPKGNPMLPPSRVPSVGIMGGSATVQNPGGFKKGGRVTKTFRYAEGGEVTESPPAPPENQAVLQQVQSQLAGDPNFVGNDLFRAVQQNPQLSGHFEVGHGGNITPHVESPQQVAAEAGTTVGELGASYFPQGSYQTVGYGKPDPNAPYSQFRLNDAGGFFHGTELLGRRGWPGPSMGEGISTNNWRLLGRGPGWIMRQGSYVNTLDPMTHHGIQGGGQNAFGATGEQSIPGATTFVPPFAALTGQNKMNALYWPGGSPVGHWAWPAGTAVKRGGRIKARARGGGLPSIF